MAYFDVFIMLYLTAIIDYLKYSFHIQGVIIFLVIVGFHGSSYANWNWWIVCWVFPAFFSQMLLIDIWRFGCYKKKSFFCIDGQFVGFFQLFLSNAFDRLLDFWLLLKEKFFFLCGLFGWCRLRGFFLRKILGCLLHALEFCYLSSFWGLVSSLSMDYLFIF